MAAAPKTDKTPSLLGALFSGLCMGFLGIVCGFLFMASFSAKAFTSGADRDAFFQAQSEEGLDPMPGSAYFMKGPEPRTQTWQQKRTAMVTEGTQLVVWTPGDLNAWMRSRFTPVTSNDSEESSTFAFVPGLPNFHIVDEKLHFSLPVDATFYGMETRFTLFGTGTYAAGPSPQFLMGKVYVNCAPFPTEGGLAAQIAGVFVKAYSQTEDYQEIAEAWQRVESVEITDGVIRVELR